MGRGVEGHASLRLRPEELLLEPAELLLDVFEPFVGGQDEIDELFAAGLREIITRHTLTLQHSASSSKRDPVEKEAKCWFGEFL